MSDYIQTDLKQLLDEGKTLIECRRLGIDLSKFPNKNFDFYSLSEQEFPDDYFEIQNDGNFYFTHDKIEKYRRVPYVGIILKDGTIYKVGQVHSQTAVWLKFNKKNPTDENFIDLTGSLRYVFFPGQKKISVVQGYDHESPSSQTDLYALLTDWITYYDGTKHNTDIMLSEKQVITLFRLCKRFNIDFEKMLNDNIGFCMQVEGSSNKRVGDENQKCINRSLRSIR